MNDAKLGKYIKHLGNFPDERRQNLWTSSQREVELLVGTVVDPLPLIKLSFDVDE